MTTYILLLLTSVKRFWDNYTLKYAVQYSWSWQYGYPQVINYLQQHYAQYDRIFFTKKYGEPHEFILFYWPWNPVIYQQSKQWDYHANWYWINGFDKFIFVNDWDIKEKLTTENPNNKYLLITSPNNAPANWNKINQINFLDGKSAFEIYENN